MQMHTSRVELFAKDFEDCLQMSEPSVERVEGPSQGGAMMAPLLKAVQSAQLRTLRRIHANAYASCGTVRKRFCTLFAHFGSTFLTLGLRREGGRGLVMGATRWRRR